MHKLTAYLNELSAVTQHPQPVVIDDISEGSPTIRKRIPPHARAAVIIPFQIAGDSRGVLVYHAPKTPSPELVETLALLVALAGSRMSEARLSRR